jgi:hypothetical protein
MIEFPKDFKEFLKLLNSRKVEYLVIGGYAVGYHGYPRATGDLDVWVSAREDNALKLAEALKEFGFNFPEVSPALFQGKEKVIRMGRPPLRLEIITTIDGVEFEKCYPHRVTADFGEFTADFISLPDLLTNKRASGRLNDLNDVERLKKRTK